MSDSAGHKAAIERRARYVVLFHRQQAGDHFDLMIENGETLATWKMEQPSENATAEGISCRRLGGHRREYLEYEGPISGERGSVTRHDEGQCEFEKQDESVWCGRFDGKKLSWRFELRRGDVDVETWTFYLFRE